MRFVSPILIVCFLCLCLSVPQAWGIQIQENAGAPSQQQREASAPSPQAQAAAAVNAFAIDAYHQLAEDEKGNIFFSPYSVSSALAMTWAGAAGPTAGEMAAALRFPEPEALHAGMKALMERFNAIPKEAGALEIANRLWLDGREKLLPEYAALLEAGYGAAVGGMDFQKNPEKARKEINEWIGQKTHDKIKELLFESNVTPDTRLVLTNAIYFNSTWRYPFEKSRTKEEPFRSGKNKQKNVPLMNQTQELLYGEGPGLQWVKLPYTIPRFSLLVFLPQENEAFTQLEALENKLTPEAIAAWTALMERRQVNLWLPKFRDERRYPLAGLLQKLGMKLAFTQKADFSRMAVPADDPLYIDFVVHQSFIELDEEKTEAAGATAVGMTRTTAVLHPQEPVTFRADRPFIYCLMDDATGTILFLGRMVEPTSP
ncbi:MAG: serpin family protein [Synergistaceae bacterium]|jgi:serpin B|nr:serpin family protein [Synergistaceae bacterium]